MGPAHIQSDGLTGRCKHEETEDSGDHCLLQCLLQVTLVWSFADEHPGC